MKTVIKYFDLVIQTLLFAIGAITLVRSFGQPNGVYHLMIVQLFLGCYQILSSIITSIVPFHFKKARILHLLLSGVYLMLFFSELLLYNDYPAFFTIAIPWLLGIYYYVITWKTVLQKNFTRQSKFLPHTSF